MGEHLERAMGPVIASVFVASVAFIFGGIWLVYKGAAESASFDLLDFQVTYITAGKVIIAIGALGLFGMVQMVLRYVRDTFPSGPGDR